MPCTRNAADTWGFSSTLTFASTTLPLVSSTTRSRMGPSCLHGPHHGAHRSTTTGVAWDRSSTSVWNVASVTSMVIPDRLPTAGTGPTGCHYGEHPMSERRQWSERGPSGPAEGQEREACSNVSAIDVGEVPEGIDIDRATEWFQSHASAVDPPLTFSLIAGGRSNLTYRVTDRAGHAWVLRRPPLGQVLATAHDMSREHRIISALAPTDVPVAPVIGLCTDEAVNGAPFYVMGFVDGLVARDRAAAEQLGVEERRHAGHQVAEVGLLLVYWNDPGDAFAALIDGPTIAEGFPRRDELIDRYAASSGRDVAGVGYHEGFGYWKLACILEGVYAPYKGGAMGTASGYEGFAPQVELLADAARDTLERFG